jgi:hypothetical protein
MARFLQLYCQRQLTRQKESTIRGILCIMDRTYTITFLDRVRHRLNPLHIYCRLTCLGVSTRVARGICKIYEVSLYKIFLGR